jgi:hypothetical protein
MVAQIDLAKGYIVSSLASGVASILVYEHDETELGA